MRRAYAATLGAMLKETQRRLPAVSGSWRRRGARLCPDGDTAPRYPLARFRGGGTFLPVVQRSEPADDRVLPLARWLHAHACTCTEPGCSPATWPRGSRVISASMENAETCGGDECRTRQKETRESAEKRARATLANPPYAWAASERCRPRCGRSRSVRPPCIRVVPLPSLRKIVVFSFFYITGVNFFVLTDQYNSVEWQEGYALGLRPEMPSGSDPLVAKKAYYTFCLSAGILGAQYGVDRPATGFMVILTLCIPG